MVVLSSAAMGQAPWLGPVRSVGATARGPAGGAQESVVSAAGTSSTLVVWHQHVLGPDLPGHVGAGLVSPTGTLMTPYGFFVSDGTADDTPLGVAFDGSNYGVLWSGNGVFLSRVTEQGVVLDPVGITLPGFGSEAGGLAFDGTNFLAVWSVWNSSSDIVGVRISRQGQVLDPTPISIAQGPADEFKPSVACGAGTCLVAWESNAGSGRIIRGARLSPGGVVSPEVALSTGSGPCFVPSVAFGTDAFLVTWEEAVAGQANILASRVGTSGAAGAPFTIAGAPGEEYWPSATFDGAQFFITWVNETTRVVAGARVSTAGTLVDPTPLQFAQVPKASRSVVVARAGGERLVVWNDYRNDGDLDLYASRLSATGAVQDMGGFPIVVSAPMQGPLDVAVASGATVLAFESLTGPSRQVEVYAEVGAALNAIALPVTTSARKSPAVASSGDGALVAWVEDADIFAAQVVNGGVRGAVTRVSTSQTASSPDVAWDGTAWVVVWKDWRSTMGGEGLFAARLDAAGQVTPAAAFRVVAAEAEAPRLACTSGRCLVAWQQATPVQVRGAIISGTGASPSFPLSGALGEQRQVDVGTDGTAFLAVWRDSRRDGVVATRVSMMGTVLDPMGRLIVSGPEAGNPSLAWDGARTLVTWNVLLAGKVQVSGLWLEADGRVTPSRPFLVAEGPGPHGKSRSAALGPGRFVTAFLRFDETSDVRATRVALRRVSQVATGAACTFAGECGTGFCVDGVCCDSACGDGAADCQACSVAAGAATSGTCGVRSAGAVCRAAAGECDVAETCDGQAVTCGADVARANDSACTGGVCSAGQCVRTDRPVFTSVPQAGLVCGQRWGYSSGGGAPTVAGAGPFTFSLERVDGAPLPEGLTVDAMTGAVSWQPTDAHAGTWELQLVVTSPTGRDVQRLDLEVTCRSSRLAVGCGAAPGTAALALLVGLWRRRRVGR